MVDSFNEKGITGFLDYFTWIDTKTWYPEGRPVARTSQVGLHFAGAIFLIYIGGLFNYLFWLGIVPNTIDKILEFFKFSKKVGWK